MLDNEKVQQVMLELRISSVDFYDEVQGEMQAALSDLGLAGVSKTALDDALVFRAVVTYCKMHFGEPSDRDWLKKSYDEQKAQLQMATGYTDWGDGDGQV